MTRRWWWVLAGSTGMLVVLLWQAWPDSSARDAQRWVQVEPQPLEVHLGLVGRLQAGRQVTLSAPFDGVLTSLLVREGQQVAAGQSLMHLDTTQLDIQLRQAEAERLKAKALVSQLRGWQAGPEVARSLRTLAGARATLAAGQAALDETRRLLDRGIVARMEVESLEQLQQAQRQAVLDAQQDLQLTQARGQGDALKIAEMELANAEAHWRALRARRDLRVVKAPFAGLLARAAGSAATPGPLQEGLALAQGMPLLTLSGLEHLQVAAKVAESDLGDLREGMEVQAFIAGHLLAGRLAQVGQQARDDTEQTAWYDVRVDLQLPEGATQQRLRLGMSARLAVLIHREDAAMVVPAEALQQDEAGRQYVVYRQSAQQTPRRVVVRSARAVVQGLQVDGLEAGFVLLP
ncbi:efflux RND transporter periplasmic adaptor subunit [Pseudomonas oryzicola]|uniref:HlyD family efflux transporter periplasmic adaptor subunit n=1 Tax=Pseudomonas oryzicola TaxID=485876 RepID=A0ABS6Q7N1_9PSED|nr:HlyD family efflux transporter periplasmic adaptor subunit [Pseudomonas oryzicola]MBV4489963.1 HlyD family efflux transporter periplasmic adaptor subunit [Pseudomonas oryzicola]